ncbi:MAG: DUF2125 domain-containing protein [Rhodospirillales bacterium]|nr:DUF2125 domain-containing protein [Rhodospirillales bacterium]MCB9995883.1 DUF2125 domain-containing protein [Rhodospirillales bacterium]
MMRFLVLTLGAVFSFVLVFYTALWFWMAAHIYDEVDDFIRDAQQHGMTVIIRDMEVKGYPMLPEAHVSGRISADDIVVDIPALLVRSLFLPNKPIYIEAPEGVFVAEPADKAIWSLSRLVVDAIIPEYLPATITHEDLTQWRDAGNKIVINQFEAQKESLTISGSGNLELDDLLQPTGAFNAKTTGHMDFMIWLQQHGYIKTREAMLASTIMTGLSKTSEEGETYMEAILTLQNRTLFVGPLKVAQLPMLVWGWRHQPARPL